MTRPEQTEDELNAVRSLARHVPELAGRPCQPGSNPPDVIVGDIGIEVREFHRARGARSVIAIEKEHARVTQAAWDAYKRRGGQRQHVSVRFRDAPLPKEKLEEIAEQLAGEVLQRQVGSSSSTRLRGDELPRLLSSCIQRINMARPGDGWDCIGGGSVENSWDAVEEMVREKETDLPSWPADVKRRWLLVVAPATEDVDGRGTLLSSSMFPHAAVLPPPTLRTRFDRAYFMDVLTDQVTRLT